MLGRPRPSSSSLRTQTGLGVTGGGLGLVALGLENSGLHGVAHIDVGQQALVGVDLGFVAAFLVDAEVAGEDDAGAACFEDGRVVVVGERHLDLDDGALQLGVVHLAGQGALPDQLIEAVLIVVEDAAQGLRPPREMGGPDRLVGLLGVAGLRLVSARAVTEIGAVEVCDDRLRFRERLLGEGDGVGPHVGDQALAGRANVDAFVEALRDLHRAAGAEAELAVRFLLQRGGDEGRRGALGGGRRFDLGHDPGLGLLQAGAEGLHAGFVEQAHAARRQFAAGGVEVAADREPLGAETTQGGRQDAKLGAQCGVDVPVGGVMEGGSLALALHQNAHGDALYASRREADLDLAPEHGGEAVAEEPVQDAARLLRVD